MSEEEKEKLELEFQYALDNIVSKIKGETATAIVHSEQSMILLFKRLMLKIEKQSKEIEELKEDNKHQWEERCKLTFKLENSTSNDKIKAKIEPKLKELDKQINEEWKKYGNSKELQDMEDIYNFLQSLLEKEEDI